MNAKTASVLLGWINLSDSEKNEFGRIVAGRFSQSQDRRKELDEEVEEQIRLLNFGPIKDPCPRCGR